MKAGEARATGVEEKTSDGEDEDEDEEEEEEQAAAPPPAKEDEDDNGTPVERILDMFKRLGLRYILVSNHRLVAQRTIQDQAP